jgi:UDP-glucuronate 4-epimerase
MKIVVTGAAGFIGFSLAQKLIAGEHEVIGLDNINEYYNVNLKIDRLRLLGITIDDKFNSTSKLYSNFKFIRLDLLDFEGILKLFIKFKPDLVIHLAAQAGVRYSIQNPRAYLESNILGHFNVLEAMRIAGIHRIVYASSSSVYGNSADVPFVETHVTDNPVSFYAATKKANELFSESYVNVHQISAIGLRFFTVYGPFGRPDMAYYSFVKDIQAERPIKLFNYGNLSRDFTFIDDIVASIIELSLNFDKVTNEVKHQIFNIGNSNPVSLTHFLNIIEDLLNKKAVVENVQMQLGDVYNTFANVEKLKEYTGLTPRTSLREGLTKYVSWFRSYYNILN